MAAGTRQAFPALMHTSQGSEGMALNLQCERPGRAAFIWRGGPAPQIWRFTRQSGDARRDLDGRVSGESELVVGATLERNDPVLVSFRRTGQISESDRGQAMVLERSAIERFFQACQSP